MRLPFLPRTRTDIDLCLNAALQPMHRARLFEDPIETILKRVAPGSRITDGGTIIDDHFEVIRSDIHLEVAGRSSEVFRKLIQILESDYYAPRGSYAVVADQRHEFGDAEGVAVRLTPSLPVDVMYNEVPSNVAFTDSLERVDDLLRREGRVLSWMLREPRTSAYVYGRSATTMTQIAVAVLRRDFPQHQISVESVA